MTGRPKVRKAEDGWNTRNPHHVALAYTVDSPGAIVLNS